MINQDKFFAIKISFIILQNEKFTILLVLTEKTAWG